MRVRMDDDEASRWTTAAEQTGHSSLSSWVRTLCDQSAATGVTGKEVAIQLAALRQDLARGIGNNINQIAKSLNQGQGLDKADLDNAMQQIHDASAAISSALRTIRPPRAI